MYIRIRIYVLTYDSTVHIDTYNAKRAVKYLELHSRYQKKFNLFLDTEDVSIFIPMHPQQCWQLSKLWYIYLMECNAKLCPRSNGM